ncbi:MAG: WD40/YVTN/BNR-like repeat-containing protein [Solirubrobacterales bacterium]
MSKRLLTFVVAAVALSLTVVAVASAAVVAGNTGWFWSNPLPQGNTLTKAETIGGRAYVAGEAGTIMRSDNGGASWTGIRSGLPAAMSDVRTIRAITADTVIFASDCGLRRTDDGGVTVRRLPWSSTDVACASKIASLSFPTPDVGYLLLDSGEVLQTSDGGESWRKQTAAPAVPAGGPTAGGTLPSEIWFTSASTGVLSVGAAIFYTTDSGSSWTPVETVWGAGQLHFEFLNASDGYVFGNRSVLFKTADGGATWTEVTGDGKLEQNAVSSLSCADMSNCLAATTDGANMLRTVDGGTTWTPLKASTQPIFAVGFTSATHALAVGKGSAIVGTDDAGQNWAPLNSEAPGAFYKAHVDSATSAVLFGGGTALARTTDAGATFKPIVTYANGNIQDAAFPTANRGYVLDSRNELTRSDDGGGHWKVLDLAGATPAAIYAPSEKTLLLVGSKGVRRSEDGGLSFKSTGKPSFRKLRFSNADKAGTSVVVFGMNNAAISKDDGKSWTTIKRGKKIKSIKFLDFADAKNGWIAAHNGELWTTSTGGKKWTRIDSTGLTSIRSMALTDSKHGYIADGSGSVFATTDGGKTWSQQSPFLNKDAVNTLIAALSGKGAILYVPGTNRILATSNFGQIGVPSTLSISTAKKSVKKGTTVPVSGKLAPSQGGEQVTVLARPAGAKNGTKWTKQTATVSLGGTFTTTWKIYKPMVFIARWAGDAKNDGDGADLIKVLLKKKK